MTQKLFPIRQAIDLEEERKPAEKPDAKWQGDGNVPPHEARDLSVSEPVKLSQEPPVLEIVTVQVLQATGDTVSLQYAAVPGNHPRENRNTVTLWSGTIIDWKHPELGVTQLVDNSDSDGSYTMHDLDLSKKDYIVGYSVTGDVQGICASAIVKGIQLMFLAPSSVTLQMSGLNAEGLHIAYATLRGNRPRDYGNWLGLWKGDIDPYNLDRPQETQIPADNANEGAVVFTTPLVSNSTYSVCYFMNNKGPMESNTTVAAVLRFDTA